MTNKLTHRAVLAGSLALGVVSPVCAEEEPRSYSIATAAEGGTYYPVGVAMAVLASIHLESTNGIGVEALVTGGSIENIRMMREDEAQFGIVQVLAGEWARDGVGPIEDAGPQENLRAVAMLWPDVAHFLIRSELAETGTVDDLANLSGHGFSMGPLGSGAEFTNAALFQNYGFDHAGWAPAFMSYDDSVLALEEGSIGGVNIGSGIGATSVVQLLSQMGEAITLLSVSDEQLQQFNGDQGILAAAFIPGGTYAGVEDSVQTGALPNFLAVNANVPEEDVYLFTRVMFENLEYLCEVHQAACALTIEGALDGLPVPIHPGAARFFNELGIEASPPVADGE